MAIEQPDDADARSARRIERVVRRARRQVVARDVIGLALAGFGAIVMAVGALLHALTKLRTAQASGGSLTDARRKQ